MERIQPRARFWLITILALVNLALLYKLKVWLLISGKEYLWDFDIYYRMAKDVMVGGHPYQVPYMQTAGPPLVIAPFFLFSALPLEISRGVLHFLNLVAMLGSSYLLARKYWPKQIVLATLALNAIFFIPFPVRFNFGVGQPNLILMFFSTLALTTNNHTKKGCVLGLMSIIKTNYVITFLTLIKKSHLALVTALITLIIGFLLSLIFIKPQVYIDFVSQRGSSTVLNSGTLRDLDYYNQSMKSTMSRMNLGQWYLPLFLSMVIMSFSYLVISEDLKSGLLLSLLLAPVLWQHYLSVIYPLVIIIGLSAWRRKWARWWLLLAVVLLCGHLRWLHDMPLIWPYTWLASHFFFGLVLLLGLQMWLHTSNDSKSLRPDQRTSEKIVG